MTEGSKRRTGDFSQTLDNFLTTFQTPEFKLTLEPSGRLLREGRSMRIPRGGTGFAAASVSFALVAALFLPSPASAKGRRGANVRVACLDGRQIEGELIAVKEDAVLLLSPSGRDWSVELKSIESVRILRKSHKGTLTLCGFLAGGAAGAYIGYQTRDEDLSFPPLLGGAILGGIGALAGWAASAAIGTDTTFTLAGEPGETIKSRLAGLARLSREYRNLNSLSLAEPQTKPGAKSATKTEEEARGEEAAEVAPKSEVRSKNDPSRTSAPSNPPGPNRRPRFRIALLTSIAARRTWGESQTDTSLFRFRTFDPPADESPHDMTLEWSTWSRADRRTLADSVSLAYEWTEHWSSDIEYLFSGPVASSDEYGFLRFISNDDGKTYNSYISVVRRIDFESLLVGLAYRPVAPSPFNRHIGEVGAAVGPAWTKVTPEYAGLPDLPVGKRLAISWRAQFSYDFYLFPALSIGAWIGYRHLQTRFKETTITHEISFREEGLPYDSPAIGLQTELTVPGRLVRASAAVLALRVGIRI